MARNLEFKVRYDTLDNLLPKLKELKAEFKALIHQEDTYFHNPKGRLKLRETPDTDDGWLIYYERPNKEESRYSIYQLYQFPQPEQLKSLLAVSLGIKTIVKKERSYWLYNNTRIHLDRVEGLGEFVELETVFQGQSDTEAQQEHQHVKSSLALNLADPIAVSYSELPREITE
ncbi:class IV adenylate cyclase [Candidatus Poribacteria bacterium]|nr:class IV adenylate cyclase [Candidatus Poribacteria bacterium]